MTRFSPDALSAPHSQRELDSAQQSAGSGSSGDECRRCGGTMSPGIAMGQTMTGVPDFPGDDHASTFSPGGPGKIIPCRKCTCCGHSMTDAIGWEDE